MGTSVSPIVVLPGTAAATPDKSAVEQATDAARAALATSGTALPPSVVQQPGAPARVDAGHPAGGQFAPSLTKELPGGTPPEAGRAPVVPDPAAPKAEEAPAPEVPPAGGEAAGDEADPLDVELPIMVGEGDEAVPLVINAGDAETAAHLRTLAEQAVAGRESQVLVEQAHRQLAEVEDMRQYGEVDPVGFVSDMLGGNAEAGEHLAKFLISSPTLFERLKPTLQKMLANPAELRHVANEVAAERATFEKQANQRVAEGRAIRQNLNEVQTTVASLLPADMPDEQRRIAYRDMLRDLKDYAEQQNLLTLPVHHIPALLADRMTALGIDAEAATARAAMQAARRPGGSTMSGRAAIPAASARRTPPAPTARPAVARPNGKAFVQNAEKKKAAASIPVGGAGSPGGGAALTPPRNADGSPMTTEQTVAWHRAQLAKGIRHY